MRYICFLFLGVFCSVKGFAEGQHALKCINSACQLAQQISDKNVRASVLAELEACKECVNEDPDNADLVISNLYENLDEIIADC